MNYVTQGVCAKEINFDIVDGNVHNLQFVGGCRGNLKALAILVEGMPVQTVITKLQGNLCQNGTSCADQLAKALKKSVETA
ncbi:MAG: hypothetical protein H6Q74_1743 [Firmicutes bacterium]|nr:hypothetical protein [Bacillota bacterium]